MKLDDLKDVALKRRLADAYARQVKPQAIQPCADKGETGKASLEAVGASKRGPNHTEMDIRDLLETLATRMMHGVEHEGRAWLTPGGSEYTPDWTAPQLAVECKGPYIHQPASIVRFHEARAAHPGMWVLARMHDKTHKRGRHLEVRIWAT